MCRRCNGIIIFDEYAGEKFCTNCGFVQESSIVNQSQQDSISIDVTKKKLQEHHSIMADETHDGNIGSVIIHQNSDYQRKKLTSKQKELSVNIRKYQQRNRIQSPSDARLAVYFQKIHLIKKQLSLSATFVNRLLSLTRHAEKARLLESKKTEIAILVLINITGKITNQPIPYTKLKKSFKFHNQSFNRYSQEFISYLKIDSRQMITTVEFVFEKFCSDMDVSLNFRRMGRKIIQYCRKNNINMHKTNAVIAASVINSICRYYRFNNLSLERISIISDVSEQSITTNSRFIKDILINVDIPKRKKPVILTTSKVHKNNGQKPVCPECLNIMIKIGGEGYDILGMDHVKFVFGRICKRCLKIYVNPKFEKYSIIHTSGKIGKSLFEIHKRQDSSQK